MFFLLFQSSDEFFSLQDRFSVGAWRLFLFSFWNIYFESTKFGSALHSSASFSSLLIYIPKSICTFPSFSLFGVRISPFSFIPVICVSQAQPTHGDSISLSILCYAGGRLLLVSSIPSVILVYRFVRTPILT